MAFSYYSAFTVQVAQVPSTQTDFPILLLPTDNRFKTIGNGGHVADSNGYDIRPYADSALTTPLTFELVSYVATTGALEMWVKIASLAVASVVYLAYGDAALNTDGSSTATWSNSFLGVYHFGDGTTLSLNDSSPNANHLTGNNTPTAGTGKVGGAISLVAASTQFADRASVTGAIAMSSSFWVNATSPVPTLYMSVATLIDATTNFGFYCKSTGRVAAYAKATTLIAWDELSGNVFPSNTWLLFGMTYSSATGLTGYVSGANGTASPVVGNGNLATSAATLRIGSSGTAGQYWNGLIDEVHLSTVERSADWMATELNNQNSPGTFYAIGTEVPVATASSLFRAGSMSGIGSGGPFFQNPLN